MIESIEKTLTDKNRMGGEERQAFADLNAKSLLTLLIIIGMVASFGGSWGVVIYQNNTMRKDIESLQEWHLNSVKYQAETNANIKEIRYILESQSSK